MGAYGFRAEWPGGRNWIQMTSLSKDPYVTQVVEVDHIRRKRDAEGKVIKGEGAGWELKVVDRSVDIKQGDRDDFLVKSASLIGITVQAG